MFPGKLFEGDDVIVCGFLDSVMYSVPHVRDVCVYVLCAGELFCVGCVGPWTLVYDM